MKSLLSILLFFAIVTSTHAQFGISAKYQSNKASGWEGKYGGDKDISPASIEYGLNYWLRLKNKRVEFLPELTYASSKASFEDIGFAIELSQFNRTSIGIGVNTHIYPLDFEGDCNCPTFSKDGNIVSKGFHWIINTGVISHNIENKLFAPSLGAREEYTFENTNQITFRAGLGIGLDIGITELFTLVPYAMYSRNFGLESPDLSDLPSAPNPSISTSLDQFNVGLRLVFRPDYIKSNGGFRRR